MGRWKSRGGKSQRREEQKREYQRRERVRRKKMQVREKVGKSRNTVFFQWFVAPRVEERLAYAVGAEPSGQMRDEIARSCGAKHISKSKCTKHFMFVPLLEVEMSKKCTPLRREARFQVKMRKTHHARTTFRSWDVENVYLVVARSTFRSQNVKSTTCLDHLWTFRCRSRGKLKGVCTLSKVSKTWAFSDTMAGVGHLQRVWKDACRVAGAVQKTCSSEMLGGQGADFLRTVAFWSIRSSGLLRWFCMTGAVWPGITCSWQEQHFRQMERKNRKAHRYEAVSSALNFPFLKEVSQNCFVFDVVNLKNWGSLAELLRFWRCQVQKLRKSRRIAASSKTEEVSQNSFVFKLADR